MSDLPIPLPTPKDSATRMGLADHEAEARRRLILAILPYQRDPGGVIELAEYVMYGSEDPDD